MNYMIVKTFPVNPFQMNCYIYYDENSKEGIIIDPGAHFDEEKKSITDFISSNKIIIKSIINTHGHIDHVLGNKWAKDVFNVPLYINFEDEWLLKNAPQQGAMFGIQIEDSPEPDFNLTENDEIKFGNCVLKVIQTPGHSPGGICLVDYENKKVFVGDCIFLGSIGRTDLWKGDSDLLLASIKQKLLTLPDDFVLYPGHYEPTTVIDEKNNNPFLQDDL
jgi:hydroxyacylglutathione hydrolase